jgi:methionyl-tRNA synthetase
MAEPYYLTTAISYPNGKPHIGHAYEAIAADVIARFQRMQGREVRLVTGTDEHGLKMAQTARAAGRDTMEFATEMSNHFREMCEKLNISHDAFCRTTDTRHFEASIALWQAMAAADDLYLDRYEGWYSVRDEAYYGEDEITGGEGGVKLSPQGTPVEWTVEESWFFRLSKYRDFLIELNETPGFIEPESRRNEVLAFLKGNELRDLSVSRTSFDWGVPVPGSPGHVMYVWVDALTTYLTGIGFPDRDGDFARFWPVDLHLIGKDITRFHTVYWPAFLKSAGLPVPKKVFSHGFLLHRGEKMSKSLGNVVDPLELAEQFGVDQLRFYLMDNVHFGSDGSYSEQSIVDATNAHLAGTYGNLVQRVVAFIARKMNGQAPKLGQDDELSDALYTAVGKSVAHWHAALWNLEINRASGACMEAAFACNKYIDEAAPWKAIKEDRARAEHSLATLICALIRISLMLRPFTPDLSDRALDILNVPNDLRDDSGWDVSGWYIANAESILFENPTPLVPILELPAEADES